MAETWFDETLYPFYRQGIRVDGVLYRGQTKFQTVEILSNERLGRVLTLDGVVQTTEADEFYYHESMTHPAILAHGRVKRVLIIGGADGGILREVLKHPVEEVVIVDIDGELIDLCLEYLPTIHAGAFDDPRAVNLPGDGAAYVAETDKRFDLILVDSTDPQGPGIVLFQAPFFRNCQRVLNNGGLMVTQNGVTFFQPDELRDAHRHRLEVFRRAGAYLSPTPTYAGAHMAFGWASDTFDFSSVALAAIARRYKSISLNTRYYNPDMHGAFFALPNHIAPLLEGAQRPGVLASLGGGAPRAVATAAKPRRKGKATAKSRPKPKAKRAAAKPASGAKKKNPRRRAGRASRRA